MPLVLVMVASWVSQAQAQGGGWLEYEWPHPENKKIESKVSYVKKMVNFEGFIGIGIYR